MREAAKRLVLVVSGRKPPEKRVKAASTVTIEIDDDGRIQKVDVNVRKQDAAQALHGLAMAHIRALDLLTS